MSAPAEELMRVVQLIPPEIVLTDEMLAEAAEIYPGTWTHGPLPLEVVAVIGDQPDWTAVVVERMAPVDADVEAEGAALSAAIEQVLYAHYVEGDEDLPDAPLSPEAKTYALTATVPPGAGEPSPEALEQANAQLPGMWFYGVPRDYRGNAVGDVATITCEPWAQNENGWLQGEEHAAFVESQRPTFERICREVLWPEVTQ